MKCISLFVCFFISLQSMIVPSYEVLISNIESKVDTIHEDRASFLSLKCRDIAMDVTSKKTDLRIEMDKQEKCVDELERRYKHKKNYYELKKMEYGLELQTIQRNTSILYPYKIQKNLALYFDEYRNVEVEYLKHKKQFDKNQNTLLLYDEYLERLSNCQSRLLKRFSHLAQINESGQHNEDSMISGTVMNHCNNMVCLVWWMEIMKLIRTVLFGKIQLKMVQSVLDAGPIRMEVFI